ncbi:MAG: type II toxin-antitoxin system ParD family antitoxin [Pseudomonadota bacterium]
MDTLPTDLKNFIDKQAELEGYPSGARYLHHLIRMEQSRIKLRERLLAGARSPETAAIDASYLETLSQRAAARKRK